MAELSFLPAWAVMENVIAVFPRLGHDFRHGQIVKEGLLKQ